MLRTLQFLPIKEFETEIKCFELYHCFLICLRLCWQFQKLIKIPNFQHMISPSRCIAPGQWTLFDYFICSQKLMNNFKKI